MLAMLAMLASAYKAIKFDFRISWHQIARGLSLETRLKNRCGRYQGSVAGGETLLRDDIIYCLHYSNVTAQRRTLN